MNENIDLTQILKDCPKGWKFYSSIYGDLLYSRMYLSSSAPKITFIKPDSISSVDYYQDGKRYLSQGECTLFPSKDQRDWSKFEAPWYKKKIEPKFHVGQYITDGYIGGQIISMEDNYTCYKILDKKIYIRDLSIFKETYIINSKDVINLINNNDKIKIHII